MRKNWLKKKKFTLPFLAVLLIGGIIWYWAANNNQPEIAVATLGAITEEVTISGQTKAASEAELAFEVSGKVARVAKQAGEMVKAGELIVALDQSELLANLAEAKANLAAEETSLLAADQSSTGVLSSTKAESALVAFKEAQNSLIDNINDAFTRSDDAIRNTADQFFNNGGSASSIVNIYVADQDLRGRLGVDRYQLELMLTAWQKDLAGGQTTFQDIAIVNSHLVQVKNFMADLAAAVNALVPGTSAESTTFEGYRSTVSTARTSINTAIANLTAAKEKYTAASSNLQVEKGGAKGQLARVEQARAKVLTIQAQLGKRVITSPLNGLVTKQEAKVGEIVSAGTVVTGVISAGNLQVEAFVPEVHVGKVAVGNVVRITFDAFPGVNFSGQVLRINPGETIVGGVPNYKTEVVIKESDSRLKTGLTANLIVETAKREGVVTVPRFALEEKAGKIFVKKLVAGQPVLVPVEVGLLGTNGLAEIISGLGVGDKVEIN